MQYHTDRPRHSEWDHIECLQHVCRYHFDPPAALAERLPMRPVGMFPGVQLGTGSHAGVDIDEYGHPRPHGNRHPKGETPDLPLGMAGVDSEGPKGSLDLELLEAIELLLLGG